jgi:hypothetical protein
MGIDGTRTDREQPEKRLRGAGFDRHAQLDRHGHQFWAIVDCGLMASG